MEQSEIDEMIEEIDDKIVYWQSVHDDATIQIKKFMKAKRRLIMQDSKQSTLI